jgi:hypothetical protein
MEAQETLDVSDALPEDEIVHPRLPVDPDSDTRPYITWTPDGKKRSQTRCA